MNSTLWRDVSILLLLTVVMALAMLASRAQGQSIRLHDQAAVRGTQVRLGDVAELEGAAALALADQVVGELPENSSQITVSLDALRRRLDEQGVHWGLLTLRGHQSCKVVRLVPVDVELSTVVSPAAANVDDEVDLGTAMTLRHLVMEKIEQFTGIPRDELIFTFHPRDEELLVQSPLLDRFEVEPISAAGIGRVPVVIRRYRHQQVLETHRLNVDVRHRTLAVVTRRSLGRGQTITPDDVEVREVVLDSPLGEVMTDLRAVVGQVSSGVLRADAVVRADHLRSPLLVRRGQLVTIRAFAGGLVVRTVARAMEDGSRGELITVRNERSRKEFAVRITGVQEAALESEAMADARTADIEGARHD